MKVSHRAFLFAGTAWAVAARPNVIIMQPDDFLFYEHWNPPAHWTGKVAPTVYLPHLEDFRNGGLQMTRAQVTSPMCGTSRYSTITGRYPSRSRTTSSNDAPNLADVLIPSTKLEGRDCRSANLAAAFQAEGYLTGVVGKWHLSRNSDPYVYADVQQTIRDCGFDIAEAIYSDNLSESWNNAGAPHNTEYIVDRAFSAIDQALADDKEFFLYVNPTAPHDSGSVLEALQNYTCLDTPEGTISQEPVIPGMTEGHGCAVYRQTIIDRANGDLSDSALGSIWVDDAVGALIQKLESVGQLENTFFLFQIDHGMEGKETLYETGTRIVQLVHFPDVITPGSTFDGLVSNIDIAPTVMEYAGMNTLSTGWYSTDGTSWKDAVAGQTSVDWNERCVIAEGGTDRTVTCGCDKLLYFPHISTSLSITARNARYGLVRTTSLVNLCDENGNYIASPANTPETTAVADGTTLARLEEILECHLSMTRPDIAVANDEYGICDSFNFPEDPSTTASPTAAPNVDICASYTKRNCRQNASCRWRFNSYCESIP